jgi:hypothetical protein
MRRAAIDDIFAARQRNGARIVFGPSQRVAELAQSRAHARQK